MNFLLTLVIIATVHANPTLTLQKKDCDSQAHGVAATSIRRLADENHFIAFQDAKDSLEGAFNQAQTKLIELEMERQRQGLPPLSRSVLQDTFRHLVHGELNPESAAKWNTEAGFLFLDTDKFAPLLKGMKRLDGTPLFNVSLSGSISGEGFGFDHHSIFYDRDNPEKNTSMLLLDFIESQVGKNPSAEALQKLDKKLGVVTTDNLGDGALAIWIRKNYTRVAKDPELRKLLREVTYYEDFGLFGSLYEAEAKSDPFKQKAVTIAKSFLYRYDILMREADKIARKRSDGKVGMEGDRFQNLNAEEQHKLISDSLKAIDEALADPKARQANAAKFNQLRKTVEDSVIASEIKTAYPKLNQSVFVCDLNRMVNPEGATFAKWSAPAQVHDKPLELRVQQLPNGRTAFLMAVPHGRKFPHSLKKIGDRILLAHLDTVSDPKTKTDEMNAVSGRDALQFSFGGVNLPPERIIELVNQVLTTLD